MLVVPAVAPIPEKSSQSTNFLKRGFDDVRDRGQWFGRVLEVILLVWGVSSVGRARA